MSTLSLALRQDTLPRRRIDLSNLQPAKLTGLSKVEIERLEVTTGNRPLTVGDLFSVSGTLGDTLVINGGSDRLDFIGNGLAKGTIIVEGDTGAYCGRRMTGGHIDVRGHVGPWLASRLAGGLITVSGDAGDYLGGIRAGEKFGMAGGTVIVDGNIGARAGDRMRRGTIIVRGKVGPSAASRMMGGTIWSELGFTDGPGPLLRRGTLIGPTVERMLPTFVDAGRHDLVVLRLLSRHLAELLGNKAPKALPGSVHKFSGDMATIGKGEILLFE